jgi:DNA polymerase III subunit gamma/tau
LRLAPLLPADETQLFYSMALHGRAELGLAPDEYSGLVMVLLRMLAFRQPGAAGALLGATGASNAPVASAAPRAEAALAATPRAAIATVAAAPVRAQPVVTAAPAAALRPAPSRVQEPPPWAVESHDEMAALPTTFDVVEPSPAPAPPPVVTAVPIRVFAPTELGDRWTELVTALSERGSIGAMVRELAMQSQCILVDAQAQPELWRLRLDRESLRAQVHRDKLQAALAEHLGHAVSLDLVAGEAQDSPAQRATAERDRRQHAAEQIIHNDPLVVSLMAQYKTARIVPGSIKPH